MIRFLLTLAALALGAGTAFALEPATPKPSPWNSFYIGGHVGYGWGDTTIHDTTGGVPDGPFGYTPAGAFGGWTVGINRQFGAIVVGLEGDMGWMDIKGAGQIASSNPAYHQDITLGGGLYGVAAARMGYAIGPTLFYAKGGGAFYGGEADQTTTKPGYRTHGTDVFYGWAAGGGVEHFITSTISLKVEYLHFDFGKQGGMQTSITDPPINYQYLNTTNLTAETVKLGVNFKF